MLSVCAAPKLSLVDSSHLPVGYRDPKFNLEGRVHQIVAAADLDALDAALGELRAAGWPARNIPIPGRTPNWAAGTPSLTGYRMRWAGCGMRRLALARGR